MILSIVNQKGGVGKTTTAINLAAALAKKRQRVLLIDSDPQGNTTSGYGFDKKALDKTIYDVLINETTIDDCLQKDVRKNLDLLPANIDLAGAEIEMVEIVSRETILKNALEPVREAYDIILIDCPPSLGITTLNALNASDGVLIPIQAEYYALEGLTQLLETIHTVKNYMNPELDIFGAVITMYDKRTHLSKQVADEVRKFFPDKVFNTYIPRNVRLSEAPGFGEPINEYDKFSRGAKAYANLAKEVIKRI